MFAVFCSPLKTAKCGSQPAARWMKHHRSHSSIFRRVLTALALLALGQPAHAQAPRPTPKLVIAPPGDGMRELFEHPDAWPQARALTGAILYADHNLTHLEDDELRAWFALMRTWNISLELEVGTIKEWGPTADATFAAEQLVWDRAIRLGATLTSIAMDEPLAASRALHKPDSYAVEQTARFIALVRQHYPTMRIGDVEPYPGLRLEDHVAWLAQLQARLREQGVAPLDFYRADVDWVSFAKAGIGSWHGVAALAADTRKAGLPFSLIYWASGYPSEKAEGSAGDDTWYVEVLGQGYAVADTGLHPDQFVLESWINAPSRIVPEDEDYTFTRSVLDFARKFAN
jgi:hypothetical protein